jgi:excisionase family DNA binding protein
MNSILINAKQAAQILNVSSYKIYELMNSRGFPTVIVGERNGRKQYRVNRQKLETWIEKGGLK